MTGRWIAALYSIPLSVTNEIVIGNKRRTQADNPAFIKSPDTPNY